MSRLGRAVAPVQSPGKSPGLPRARGFQPGEAEPNPLPAAPLGDDVEARRDQLRTTLPIGRVVEPTRACTALERAVAFVNDVGLLAEDVDTLSRDHLGNFPQALSHIGVMRTAWANSEIELHQMPRSRDQSSTRALPESDRSDQGSTIPV
jgi:hypothetical protein